MNGLWRVFRIGIERMLTSVQNCQDIHLRPQFDVDPRAGSPGKAHRAVVPTSTRLKKFTFATRSRGPRPHFPSSTRKLSLAFL